MDTWNALLTSAAELLLAPFRHFPATGLVVWSAVTGIIMTYIFGRTSNQRALRRTADDIRAQLLAVKLFKDDLFVTFQCQLRILRSAGLRVLHSLPPMLVMIVPLLFVLAQLAMRYEYRSLVRGEQAVVAMHVKPASWKACRDVFLSPGDGFVVETEALRDEQNSTIYWRVRAEGSEPAVLEWTIEDRVIYKQLPISTPGVLQISNPKRAASTWHRLLFPAESGLAADSPIDSIEVQLASRDTPILGWKVPWWATFFVVSMLVALMSSRFMGVQY